MDTKKQNKCSLLSFLFFRKDGGLMSDIHVTLGCVPVLILYQEKKRKEKTSSQFQFFRGFFWWGVFCFGVCFFSWTLNDSINSILPHLYRDPASASPDGSVSLFLMNDSKTTGCGESRENRKSRFFSLQIEFNNRKDKQFL